MKILEQVACDIFRLVSAQVKGTPPNMKVDPYKIKLNAEISNDSLELEDSENLDPLITKDVDLMWFYPKPELA
jgi:hypothetical protein